MNLHQLKIFAALWRKDALVELRSKETAALIAALALLLSVIAAFGVNSAFLDPATTRKVFPIFIWLVFVFAATVSIGRSYDFELAHMAVEGLLLAGTPPHLIYLAKAVTNFFVVLLGHAFAVITLSVLLNIELGALLLPLLYISLLVVVAYAALATLLAAVSSTSKLRNMLLPLILLPLLFPVLFAALETTSELMARGTVSGGSFWVLLLMLLDVCYLVLGCLLYGAVIRE